MEKRQNVIEKESKGIRVLMVSVEYPPIKGGLGRYTHNLNNDLVKLGCEVHVACNEKGNGQFSGLSPRNENNSDILLSIIDKLRPDIVHIQYEHGSYGLKLDPIHPRKISTNIDLFYQRCKIPIITTFHSTYNFQQWMSRVEAIKSASSKGHLEILMEYWNYLLNYKSLHALDRLKLKQSHGGVVFSNYMAKMIGGGTLIYHGAEPAIPNTAITKQKARTTFSLPRDGRIAIAVGFRSAVKGWDILEKIQVPNGWTILINSSKNEYGLGDEKIILKLERKIKNLICLQRDFLSDEEFSLLLYSADATILPYKLSSGSGVMFDGLAHGLPFIASDLPFFREFSLQGLGITVKRDPAAFTNGMTVLDKDYDRYVKEINKFKENLSWHRVAAQHIALYNRVLSKPVSEVKNKISDI